MGISSSDKIQEIIQYRSILHCVDPNPAYVWYYGHCQRADYMHRM